MSAKKFEQNFNELKELVADIQSNEMDLKKVVKDFEKASLLYSKCLDELKNAEQKISVIRQKNAKFIEESFED